MINFDCTHPEWAKELVKPLWTLTSSTLLYERLPSGRRYRALSTRTTRHRTSFFPQAIISWTLDIKRGTHNTIIHYLFITHLFFHVKFAHFRPHTLLSVLYFCTLFFIICVLFLSFCCTVALLSLELIPRMCKHTWPIKLILILIGVCLFIRFGEM